MMTRFLGVFSVLLAFAGPSALAAPAAGAGDIARLVNEASAYRTGESLEPFRGIEALVRQSLSSPALRPQVEAGLAKMLDPAASLEARGFACRQLGIIGGGSALPALAKLLGSDETTGMACLALTTYPPGKADALLRNAVVSASGTSRIQIITTLGDRRDSRSVGLLVKFARDRDRALAEAAAAALGKVGDNAARKAIRALRHAAEPTLAPALDEAMLRCAERLAAAGDWKRATAAYEELLASSAAACTRRGALDALLRLDPDGRRRRILDVLHGMDSDLKPVAIAAVRTVPPRVSSEPFADELHNLAPAEQVWMIDSLAERSDVNARIAISKSVSSTSMPVRLAAYAALGRMGAAWAVPMLTHALSVSKDPAESRAIESALVNLPPGANVNKAISSHVKRCSGNDRACFISVLARRVGPGANPTFLVEAQGSDPAAAKAAFRALATTATESDAPVVLDSLVAAREKDVREAAELAAGRVLAKVQNVSTRSALVRDALGRAKRVASRVSLLGLLPGCADAPALGCVKTALTDAEPRLREAAIRALADWPEAAAWDTLLGLYTLPPDEVVRAIALRGLVRLTGEGNGHPDAELAGRYLVLIRGARSDAELKLILGTLGQAAHPETLRLATDLLSRPGVRAEAEVAVRKIAEAIKGQFPEAAEQALQKIQPAK